MDLVFFIALLCLLVYIGYKNFDLIKRYRHNKEYIECYREMLNETDSAYDRICKYIDDEKSLEFKNKALILKLYVEMGKEMEYRETLNSIDLKPIFYNKDKLSKQKVSLNSDIFIWIFLDFARARKLSKFDILNSLYDKLMALTDLENRIEYQLAKALYNALSEKEDAGVTFFNAILEGDYTSYEYEKNLIGLYKRFVSSTLAYDGEPIEDYYKNDLHSFAATSIGKNYMKDLDIYDKYPPIEENTDETVEEEVIEEETTEEAIEADNVEEVIEDITTDENTEEVNEEENTQE